MRRADRLIKIVHFLRRRRQAVTAKRIAEEFEICKRTVYRDIQDLMDSGVPIKGEAGVGYVIDREYYLPPVTFDADELEALALGLSMVRLWTDNRFADKADSAFEKIQAVLPTELQGELQQITTYATPTQHILPWDVSFSELRECIRTKRKIHIHYSDGDHRTSSRTLRPLALIFCSPVWMLAGWCEMREGFRHFRLDRIEHLHVSDESFEDEDDKDLAAYTAYEAACHAG
ncbi:MAG: transcriptional regulator [Deltaproteobacteria bacterium]|nr:transcriptional regulator [Deltaproteobacteria bacterium]